MQCCIKWNICTLVIHSQLEYWTPEHFPSSTCIQNAKNALQYFHIVLSNSVTCVGRVS